MGVGGWRFGINRMKKNLQPIHNNIHNVYVPYVDEMLNLIRINAEYMFINLFFFRGKQNMNDMNVYMRSQQTRLAGNRCDTQLFCIQRARALLQ